MEDHKQSRTQPDADKEEKILDLTKDMELANQEKHKIFDLSEGTDQPEVLQQKEPPLSPTPSPSEALAKESIPQVSATPAEDPTPPIRETAPAQPEKTLSSEEPMSEDKENIITDESSVLASDPLEEAIEPQAADSDAETGDQTDEPELTLDETVSMPDAPERDDAGENKNSDDQTDEPELVLDETVPTPDPPERDDAEDEKHSIEDEVDAAFDEVQSEPPPPPESNEGASDQLFDKLSGITQMVDDAVRDIKEDDSPEDTPTEPADDTILTSDAAELEAAISGEDDEEEIIELTDIVDPEELAAAAEGTEAGDNDIIDLVDIVDPAELEAEAKEAVGETVDPADLEFAGIDVMDQDIAPAEEDLALSDLDELDQDDGVDIDRDEPDDFDTTELDKLFEEDFLGEEKAAEESGTALDEGADHDEEVILLSDVLKEGGSAKQPPAAEITDEDTAEDRLFEDTPMEADIPPSVSSPPDAKEQEDLSKLTIEAAVEHLLKTKYADTIQQMVADAVEKAVTREVENIKQGFSNKGEPEG